MLRTWWSRQAWRRGTFYGLLIALSCLFCLTITPARAISPPNNVRPIGLIIAQASLDQGRQLYENGQLAEAAQVLQRVANSSSSPEEQIVARRNLALVYRQLGLWPEAEGAIAEAQFTLTASPLANSDLHLAQLLDVKGSIQLDQGQGKAAIVTWQQAIDLYTELARGDAALKAQINQVQAMQQLGFHRQAVTTLTPVVEALAPQPASLTEAIALRTLGDSLLQTGNLREAETVLASSLAMAQALPNSAAVSAAALSLGNLKAVQDDYAAALEFYRQAEANAADALGQAQAQLNRLKVLVETDQIPQAQALWPSIQAGLKALPPTQAVLFAQVNLAQTLIKLSVASNPTPRQIADLLATTIKQTQALEDFRSESFATGTLGHLYETQAQWSEAEELSRQALVLAQTIDATDVVYQWEWQLGRIYKAESKADLAIAAYGSAVDTLQSLRTDLVAVNPAVQVSFQENVEPIHREYVALLLDASRQTTDDDLEKARHTIESLQLAELDNFFREACLDAAEVDIDQLDQRAAVVYPVILADRLEVIVSLPDQPLRHYASSVSAEEMDQTIGQLQQFLVLRVGQQYLPPARQLYDWMMRPIMADLAASPVDTLVFVLDGELRNIPMAVLNDGEQFLIEQYNLALTPGLQLVNPRPIQAQALRVLTGGVSESRQGFSALPNVIEEVETIESTVPAAAVLLNETFTTKTLADSLAFEGAPIVHLATHGKFSSSSDETFVLTWDDRLTITDLNDLLQRSEFNQEGPIELLVLSACQTATGDKQAALGLAGMAVRSGARSTIATLWQVNDEATAMLMTELYSTLANQQTSKAEALRQAQLKVLQEPKFRRHPFFWAPYVLVGNWL